MQFDEEQIGWWMQRDLKAPNNDDDDDDTEHATIVYDILDWANSL